MRSVAQWVHPLTPALEDERREVISEESRTKLERL